MVYNADSVPWSGLFVAACMDEAKIAPAKIAVRATAWAMWGKPMPTGALALGAVLVFERPGGGPVAFYVGENATHYQVLGGDRGDCVSTMRLEKGRCIAARWPAELAYASRLVKVTASGLPCRKTKHEPPVAEERAAAADRCSAG